MKLRFRIISVFLILVLLPAMAVPSYAFETASNIINLFETEGFDVWVNGSEKVLDNSFRPYIKTTGSSYSFLWSSPHSETLTDIVFSFVFSEKPSSISVGIDEFTFDLGEPVSINGMIYQYVLSDIFVGISDFDIFIQFSNSSLRDIGILSCVGYTQSNFPVLNISSGQFYCDYLNKTSYSFSTEVLWSSDNVTFPLDLEEEHIDGESNKSLSGGTVDLYFTIQDLQFSSLDTLSILFYTTSSSVDVGASLMNATTGSVISVLDYSYKTVNGDGMLSYHDTTVPFTWWEVQIDLAGFDLEDCMIHFSVWGEPYPYSGTTLNAEGVEFHFWGCSVSPLFEYVPWYSQLFRNLSFHFNNLGSWISNQTSNLSNIITNEFNLLKNHIVSFNNWIYSNLKNYFDSVSNTVSTWGQNIVNAINPDPAAGEDAKDQGAEKGQEIGNLNDQMNSMVKPDLSGSGDISSIISPGDLTNYTTFLTTVVNAPYISQVVMLSLILSLAGYVLFGKR